MRDESAATLHRLGVTVLPYTRLYGSDADSVYLQHVASSEAVIVEKVDTLVLCTGHSPISELADMLEGLHIDVHIIGDAAAPRTAEKPSTMASRSASSYEHRVPGNNDRHSMADF